MPKKMPLVSVIILNYNGMEFVESCLESVLSTDYPDFEVLFIDNASIDGSLEYVEDKFGRNTRIKIVANEKNYGFAEGNNIGFKHTEGEYVVFLNIDTDVEPDWLSELVKVFEADPTIGAVQSKLLLS